MVEVALALVARTSPQIHHGIRLSHQDRRRFFFVGLLLVVMADRMEHFINGMDGLFLSAAGHDPFYQ